ncbi:MAG: hypothetical protein M3M95_08370 [Pseudomonadota bacterium]|nr:hypothetical protein [Pseudomonadota bacterium]
MTPRSWGWAGALALALAAVLAGLVWALRASWRLGGDTPIGLHGWLAMGIALVGVAVVGGGLMWLAFYSARSGWDDIDREP